MFIFEFPLNLIDNFARYGRFQKSGFLLTIFAILKNQH